MTGEWRSADTGYSLEHFLAGPVSPDREFLYRRLRDATVAEAVARSPRRVLDVGSGGSLVLGRVAAHGCEAWAVEPSPHMIALARMWAPDAPIMYVRAIGERLAFADGTFDRVICQASLDHFAAPGEFMQEAARVLAPAGRVIVSLQNFDGLACRLGRLGHGPLRRARLHRCADKETACWAIPADHTFRGDLRTARGLGGSWLELERVYGVSLLCMLYGWGRLLGRMPAGLRERLLGALDGIARRIPSQADVIVSVWKHMG